MARRRTKIVLGGLTIFLLFSAFALNDRFFAIAKSMSIFSSLYKEVNAFYVDQVNPNKLMNDGIDAMLSSLDPYTNYIPEDRIEDFRTLNTGQYGGIGASTIRLEEKTFISMIFDGYPAQESGLQIGDEVLSINGVAIEGKTRDQIGQLMKGQSDTDVTLVVNRYGEDEPIDIEVSRTKVTINNVPYFGMVEGSVGYVKLNEFTQNASKNVKSAVVALKKQGAESIILDLRGNPGGLLVEAVNLSNIFVPKGAPIVSTKGKIEENNTEYRAMFDPTDIDIPLAVLINSSSASASEIVAGVMQDYDRGVLVGQKSYGKGLVQTTRRLSYNAQLKVTTAKYYIPSGRCIQAIDYSNRRHDGSVGKIPDSLITDFNTLNGRRVLDGGGVDPDVEIDDPKFPEVATNLIRGGYIFKYASEFHFNNESIASPSEFQVSDSDYQDLLQWLDNNNFQYQTQAEEDLKKIFETATEENRWDEIRDSYEKLNRKIQAKKEQDLIIHEDLIKSLLEEELVSRYYLQSGAIEAGFDEDPYVSKAVQILNDQDQYSRILRTRRR